MKKIIIAAALGLASLPAMADSSARSSTQSQAVGTATNQGNAQAITFNNQATDRMKTTPSVGGQGFYGSFSADACTVSAGGGGSSGFLGINVVLPVDVTSCIALRGFERTMQGAATFQAIGDDRTASRLRQAGIDMLCQVSDEVGKALRYQGLCSDLNNPYELPTPKPVILAGPTVNEIINMRINLDGSITEQRL